VGTSVCGTNNPAPWIYAARDSIRAENGKGHVPKTWDVPEGIQSVDLSNAMGPLAVSGRMYVDTLPAPRVIDLGGTQARLVAWIKW